MSRPVRIFIYLALVASFTSVYTAYARTFYIATNGSDSNTGSSTASPWLHAPGMAGCSGSCASTTPTAGDQFIFRGGDVWHYFATGGTGGNPVGLPWNWKWSGSSGSPIYIGVDKTWFAGTSWARPILSMDNPTSTAYVTSCAHDEYSSTGVELDNVNYITFDDFEFTGLCWQQQPTWQGATYLNRTGTNIVISNSYFHGWTEKKLPQTGCCNDAGTMITGSTSAGINNNVVEYNVIDGEDTCCGWTSGVGSGWGLYTDAYDVHHNVFRYIANGLNSPSNLKFIHDNLYEYLIESYDDYTHGGLTEQQGNNNGSSPIYFYNNLIRHNSIAVGWWPMMSSTSYQFNNVIFDFSQYYNGNCLMMSPDTSSGSRVTYFFNNTIVAPCQVQFYPGNSATPAWNGTAHFENNHYIGFSSAQLNSTYFGNSTVVDGGSELFQTASVANGQGYTSTNNYAPNSGGSTVGTGANLTALCNSFADAVPQAACKQGFTGAVQYDSVNHAVIVPPSPPARPASGAWDIGAYQFSSSASGGPVNPPTNLTATVN